MPEIPAVRVTAETTSCEEKRGERPCCDKRQACTWGHFNAVMCFVPFNPINAFPRPSIARFLLRLPDPVERLVRDGVLSEKEAQLGRMFLDVAQIVELQLQKADGLPL